MNKRLRTKDAITAAANMQTGCLLYLLQNHFWRLNFAQFRENQTQHLVHNKMEWYWQEQPWRRVRKATLQSWLIIMKTRGGDDLLTASDRSGLLSIRLPLHRNSQGAEFHAGKQNCLFHLPPLYCGIPILLVHFKNQTLQNFLQQIRVGTATLSDSLKNPPAES